jgi:hypothetical protein
VVLLGLSNAFRQLAETNTMKQHTFGEAYSFSGSQEDYRSWWYQNVHHPKQKTHFGCIILIHAISFNLLGN